MHVVLHVDQATAEEGSFRGVMDQWHGLANGVCAEPALLPG